MALASLHQVEHRNIVYKRLGRRNGVVAVLRIAVPICGVLLLAFLIVQIYIANIADQYGISGITLGRDELIIDTPKYGGTAANGTEYTVTADKATALLTDTNILNLANAILDVERPDGFALNATSVLAQYDLLKQTITVPNQMRVLDSRQTDALLENVFIDWAEQTLTAASGAHILFPDGTTLDGDTMVFDGKNTEWTFTNARLMSNKSADDTADTAPFPTARAETSQ
jgi:lipopolysaccharide export system protein LptC